MRVSVVGSGYVGTTLAACLADFGHRVNSIDVNESVVDAINDGTAPIQEPGLSELLETHAGERLTATTDHAVTARGEMTILAVGTPAMPDGRIDPSSLVAATEDVGAALCQSDEYHVVVVKSTVLPDIIESEIRPALESTSGKTVGDDIGLAVNPEFLREGSAVADLQSPDRIVFGVEEDNRALDRLHTLYESLIDEGGPAVIETDRKTAAMIKYANNAFLATKLSTINDIGNICKLYDVDAYDVAQALGCDSRIEAQYLRSGLGWGGSCLPKDTAALARAAIDQEYQPLVIEAAIDLNDKQPQRMVSLLESHVDISTGTIAILGLSFKPETDDVRHSRAIPVIETLRDRGASVVATDPARPARAHITDQFPDITVVPSAATALEGADGACVVTGWPQYHELDSEFDAMETPVVVDGRRVIERREGLIYEGLTW